MSNQLITYYRERIVLPENMSWQIDKIETVNGFRKPKIKFSEFPQAVYYGVLGDNHVFDLYGIHGQDFPRRAYCKIVIKK